jgi:hypothetical protein
MLEPLQGVEHFSLGANGTRRRARPEGLERYHRLSRSGNFGAPLDPRQFQQLMQFFDTRRARVRPEFAALYPEIVPGVWLSAHGASRLVRRRGLRGPCLKQGCARGRVLCDLHFEFRGGRPNRQAQTGEWIARLSLLHAQAGREA